ncbi:hypothetical protein [Rubritalea tangerina]|uniref:Serine protease n=1 Tax=Rubritalea tangerina TaxID=430798 RepID=A0ABW4ZB85_9BACT
MMKPTQLMKLSAAGLVCGFGSMTAFADIKSDAKEVFENNQSSVLTVKGLMKVEVSMNGQVAQTKDVPITSQAVVVDKGLLLVSYRTIMPEVGTNVGQQPGIKIDTNMQELKVVDASGDEFDAKLVLHDEALDLAYLAIDPKGENAGDFSAPIVDLSKGASLSQLDDVVLVNRHGESLRYVAGVSVKQVSAVIEKPRKSYVCSGVRPGAAVFGANGDFVGLGVVKKGGGSGQAATVVLPSKYAQKLLGQAKEKRDGLSKEA